jgi:predicted phosphodiesterase
MRLAVLADTHLRDAGSRVLPSRAWELVRGADAVLHAGDVVEPGLLAALAEVAPVHAVLGNNDLALARGPAGRVDSIAASPTPISWSSATATSRGTKWGCTGSGC